MTIIIVKAQIFVDNCILMVIVLGIVIERHVIKGVYVVVLIFAALVLIVWLALYVVKYALEIRVLYIFGCSRHELGKRFPTPFIGPHPAGRIENCASSGCSAAWRYGMLAMTSCASSRRTPSCASSSGRGGLPAVP